MWSARCEIPRRRCGRSGDCAAAPTRGSSSARQPIHHHGAPGRSHTPRRRRRPSTGPTHCPACRTGPMRWAACRRRSGSAIGIPLIPGDLVELSVPRASSARTAGVLPFRLGRQPVPVRGGVPLGRLGVGTQAIRGRQPLPLGQGVTELDRVPPRNTLDRQPLALGAARPSARDSCVPGLRDREHRHLKRRDLDRPAALRPPVRQRHLSRRDRNHLASCPRIHNGQPTGVCPRVPKEVLTSNWWMALTVVRTCSSRQGEDVHGHDEQPMKGERESSDSSPPWPPARSRVHCRFAARACVAVHQGPAVVRSPGEGESAV